MHEKDFLLLYLSRFAHMREEKNTFEYDAVQRNPLISKEQLNCAGVSDKVCVACITALAL